MLIHVLLLATLACFAECGINNIPRYDPTERVIDCTEGKDATDVCHATLVVEYLVTMAYFDFSNVYTRAYRVAFNTSTGQLQQLITPSSNTSNLVPPIQADGHFRTIITVNAQMPGPTIIAHHNQMLNITVFNELRNAEGISIHWHGIHQTGTPQADGVSHITQNPIPPHDSFTYTFRASPPGTHWYHAHSGEQRNDGLYGAFIVKDTLFGNVYDNDDPVQHTLLLMDWQREAAVDIFTNRLINAGFYKQSGENLVRYFTTFGADRLFASIFPFWSGIINDKGRFYNEDGQPNIINPNCNNVNCFNVSRGGRYRFRLIGAQRFFKYRFSIEGHSMTVVASDGSQINSIEGVDYVIVNPDERFDVVVHADSTEQRNFWIWAETLKESGDLFYNPINKHRAEAILHYMEYNDTGIEEINETKTCTSSSRCKAVNCPFTQYGAIMDCTNVEQFESPFAIPPSIHSPNITLFYSIGIDATGNFIDSTNFRFPANPPLTEYTEFQNSNNKCPTRGCDRSVEPMCACTQVIDISELPRGSVVEIVIVNRNVQRDNSRGDAHPIHLHGHYFYVAAIGYAENDDDGAYVNSSDDIECIVRSTNQTCTDKFITVEYKNGSLKQEVRWKGIDGINTENKSLPRKDTLIVPYGGYAVIRFILDNPGWWLFHCHIDFDQATGMAAIIKELPDELYTTPDNQCIPMKCEPCTAETSSSDLMLIIMGIIFLFIYLAISVVVIPIVTS